MSAEDAAAVAAAVADAHRREWAFVLAATVRVTRDLDAAEECAQDAFAAALTDWRAHGVPARPRARPTTTGRRRADTLPPPPGAARPPPPPPAGPAGAPRPRAPGVHPG